jgi:hypothetical protein
MIFVIVPGMIAIFEGILIKFLKKRRQGRINLMTVKNSGNNKL